jgi:nicotinamidase-related amidase
VENLSPIICYYREAENLNDPHYLGLTRIAMITRYKRFNFNFNFQLNADNAAVYDTVIFAGPPPMKQRLWPRHCVQDTWGSELHKDLKVKSRGVCSIKKLLTLALTQSNCHV